MPQLFAFLRAINVGGRNVVKMEALKKVFTKAGFTGVETFIASGNVIFEAKSKSGKALEQKIQAALTAALGYEVSTFIRTHEELHAIAAYEPFGKKLLADARALNVGMVTSPLDPAAVKKIKSLRTEIDEFHVDGREVYWLCRFSQSDSKFSNAVFERAICRATWRGLKTMRALAEKYPRA